DGIDHRWAAWVDPTAVLYLTTIVAKGKTNTELNQIGWMTHGWFLVNRLVTLVVGFGLPLLAALSFSPEGARVAFEKQKQPKRVKAKAVVPAALPGPLQPLGAVVPLRIGGLRQLARVGRTELRLLTPAR